MFEAYAGAPELYDEVYRAPGVCRPQWEHYLRGIRELGPREFTRRWEEARRQIQENGIAYNVYNKEKNSELEWPVDPIPLIVTAAEWGEIEASLIQRATLFDCILADLYGPQRLIRERIIPAQLLYANPGFLRPCFTPQDAQAAERRLCVCAASIARARDGSWWVINDHTQAPSGAGYALENRLILARAFPEVFQQCNVRRLAGFFRGFRAALIRLAANGAKHPRIVVLTPGPYNETYSEHSFLARYLGYPLVEGSDLTVRDNFVYLKTLEGLLRVDVIIRRIDDDYCDPVELRSDSLLGVAGLTEAERSGNVKIVNPLGSGLLEAPAFNPFLPALCRFFLQQDLRMPSVATWWCGQEAERRYVLEHLDQLIIKPAFARGREPVMLGGRLSGREREHWREKILRRPWDFVGQELFSNSVVPAWSQGSLAPRHFSVRVHLAFDGGGGYRVLPGGMTRVPGQGDLLNLTMQRGGVSKDTWVLTTERETVQSLLPQPGDPPPPPRRNEEAPSRLADHLFWLGRHSERAELLTRNIRAAGERFVTGEELEQLPDLILLLWPLCDRLGESHFPRPDANPAEYRDQIEALLQAAIDRVQPFEGLLGILRQLRYNAWSVRDRISTDWWRILNRIEHDFDPQAPHATGNWNGTLERLNQLVISLSAFGGYVLESMTRGHGWHFLELGRRVERAIGCAYFLQSCLVWPLARESVALHGVLEVCDCETSHRARYFHAARIETVLELLIRDESNPRSIASQLSLIVSGLGQLPRVAGQADSPEVQQLARALLEAARRGDVCAWSAVENGCRIKLYEFLRAVGADLTRLTELLGGRYFSHFELAQHLKLAPGGERA